jgi:predicted dehydrogenase
VPSQERHAEVGRELAFDVTAVDYRPRWPATTKRGIGLVGCGGISGDHLRAYRAAGFPVVAICDLSEAAAIRRQREFYPDAVVYTDVQELLRQSDVEVVDIATHPAERAELIRAALLSGRHVLSQKPFVTDLRIGQQLVELADRQGVHLAVNQNARWAPHLSFLRETVKRGWLGETYDAQLSVHWDHGWVKGTAFESIHHLILFDFAIHWFDITRCLIKQPVRRVFARSARAPNQVVRPPLLAHAVMEFDQGQATLIFDGSVRHAARDWTYLVGSAGTAISQGNDYQCQRLVLETERGRLEPHLEGNWFSDAFAGTMGELLLSIEERRASEIAAADNLESLAVCFAAAAADLTGTPKRPWEVLELP